MVLLSLAWNTMFWMAFTFVGEPDETALCKVTVYVGYTPFYHDSNNHACHTNRYNAR